MLKIVTGRDWKALSRCVRDRIIDAAERKNPGQVLIVPEQYSFETERALCAGGGDSISRWAEVLSFSRLAERACARCGGVARPVLDRGGRIMALAKTVGQLRPRLKFYAKSARRADFLLQMLSIVDELKCYRVDSRALAAASERLEGALAVKTQELAMLLEGYETQCAEAGPDPRDRLEQLADHIRLRDFGQGLHVYVEGFFGFTAQELMILEAFLARGIDVSVYLCCDGAFDGTQVFSFVRQTARELMLAADRAGTKVQVSSADIAMTGLGEAALSAFTRQPADLADGLRLYPCAGAQEEAEAICAEILAHVRGGGRFRDIAVACGNTEEYRPILEAQFERLGIPAFFAGKQPALRTSLMNATLCALRAAGGRMEREDVIAYLRSDASPIGQDECDRVENYAFVWNISGDAWGTEWTRHPRGYDNALEEADRIALAELNRLRLTAIAPLCTLQRSLRACKNVGECVVSFYDFLRQTEFSRHVSLRLTELEQAGQAQSVQVMRQLYDLLINALEQLYGVQYDMSCSPEEFLRLMEILLSQYQVGAIPAVLDAVTVGDCAAFEHRQTPVLFLCGCNDGSFPRPALGGSLLTEPERRRLRDAGVGLAPDENERMDRNLVGAYALLSAAEERIYISAGERSAWLFTTLCSLYPQAVATGSDAPPTEFATEQTLGLAMARGARLADAPEAAAEYCRRLQQAGRYGFGRLSQPTVHGLYGETVFLSASRIDRLAACRFHFFLHDGLKARERRAAEFDAPIYGTLVHAVFENAVAQVMREGGFRRVSRERMRALVQEQIHTQLRQIADPALLSSGRFSYLMQRNFDEINRVADVLYDELHESDFAPADFELTFGNGGALPPVQVGDGAHCATVSGAVDRVDLAEIGGQLYYRVVDYKTGRKDFDYTDLLERRGLQMLIYMFALERYGARRYGRPVHPAGVLYVPAHDDLLRFSARPEDAEETARAKQKSHRRQGLIMNDELLLQAMEPCGEKNPTLLPYKRGKQGPGGDLMDLDQLGMLRRYVDRALDSVNDEILGGEVRPNPYIRGAAGACTWCPYADICHLDLCDSETRILSATKAEDFWARLARKEAHNG